MISAILSLALAATAANGDTTKPAKPKKICQKIEVTGSTVPKRVCRTVVEPAKPKAEADQVAADKIASENTN